MARRILSHKAMRADFDAAERRKTGEGEDKGAAASAKKRQAAVPKESRAKRTRAAKVVRQRVVWAVFNNSNVRVQTFAYPQKQEADEYAAKMRAEKGGTFFVQPVKEAIEDNKD
jgi:hypothetical protein